MKRLKAILFCVALSPVLVPWLLLAYADLLRCKVFGGHTKIPGPFGAQ